MNRVEKQMKKFMEVGLVISRKINVKKYFFGNNGAVL